MDFISLDWNSILENTISNLSVGLILGLVGYFIWKKQHTYQKRLEVYAEFMPHIYLIKVYLENSFDNELNEKEKEIVKKLLRYDVYSILEKFIVYFGKKYRKPVAELALLLSNYGFNNKRDMNKEEFNNYIAKRIDMISSSLKK